MPRYSRASDVLWRNTPDGVLILPAGGSEPFSLTGAAVPLWDLLARPLDVQEAVHELATLYGKELGEVDQAIAPYLAELEQLRAVTVVEAAE